MQNRKSFFLGLLLLFGGGMIYVLFRSRQTLLLQLIDATPLSRLLTSLRALGTAWQPSDWMVFSLPGGLWSSAYILTIHSLMYGMGKTVCWRWASVIPLVGALSELCQGARLLPGVFDISDLLSYLLPFIIYTIYLKPNISIHER